MKTDHRGFTLIEMLVVIGIIAILTSLLLPAVQAARESARKSRCAANLKNLIQASHSFAAAHGGFPPAHRWARILPHPGQGPRITGRYPFSPQVLLLPYLEEATLYHSINFDTFPRGSAYYGDLNLTASSTRIDTFLCPSDPMVSAGGIAPVSYRCNKGVEQFTFSGGVYHLVDSGVFTAPEPVRRLSEISDGQSTTLAFSEKPIGSSTSKRDYSPFRDWTESKRSAVSADEHVASCSLATADWPQRLDSGRTWLSSGAINTAFYAILPPNSPIPDCGSSNNGGNGVFTARSYHPGGVQAAMVDGSVRFFTSSTSIKVWRALGTRAGGEVVDLP